jgi:hypothetical protein
MSIVMVSAASFGGMLLMEKRTREEGGRDRVTVAVGEGCRREP